MNCCMKISRFYISVNILWLGYIKIYVVNVNVDVYVVNVNVNILWLGYIIDLRLRRKRKRSYEKRGFTHRYETWQNNIN